MTFPSLSVSNAPSTPAKRNTSVISRRSTCAPPIVMVPSVISSVRIDPLNAPESKTTPLTCKSIAPANSTPRPASIVATSIPATSAMLVQSSLVLSAAARFSLTIRSLAEMFRLDGSPNTASASTLSESAVQLSAGRVSTADVVGSSGVCLTITSSSAPLVALNPVP